jgi:hypothetical protein
MRKSERRKIERATAGEPSIAPDVMPPRLNWAVMWIKGDRVIEKWCGDDFSDALRLYDLARNSGRKAVTLRCANYAFPPPERLRPHTRTKIVVKEKFRKGRKRKVRVRVAYEVHKLRELNAQGVLWCPYCIKLRRFEKQDGFYFEGIFVQRLAYYCPMCGISHEHGLIRKFNPLSYKLDPPKRIRRGKGGSTRRKR